MAELLPYLRVEVNRVCDSLFYGPVDEIADDLWSLLSDAYEAEGRHYHTLKHIETVVEFVTHPTQGVYMEPVGWIEELVVAALFHDFVYDSKAALGENERFSADRAEEWLAGWRHTSRKPAYEFGDTVGVVKSLILDTIEHKPTTTLGRMLCDADLISFSAPWEQFVQNNENIRKEYSWVSDADWKKGRGKVLEYYLNREPFYYYADDQQAKANLTQALEEL